MSTTRFKCSVDAPAIDVLLERAGASYRYRVAERSGEVELESTGPGEGWMRLDGAVVPFYFIERNGRIQVWASGRTYTLERVKSAARRVEDRGPARAPTSDRLTAPMPGSVRQILVRAGDAFRGHQPLVIMESMKMELTLSVPHAGRVKEIACQEGQLVEMGALLIRLEQAD